MITTSPKHFARHFGTTVPGTWRRLTTADVIKLTELGLIMRYGYYSPSQDVETIRRIMAYEKWRVETRHNEDSVAVPNEKSRTCKSCGQPLPAPPPDKRGRHREYCSDCQSSRSKERSRKWRLTGYVVGRGGFLNKLQFLCRSEVRIPRARADTHWCTHGMAITPISTWEHQLLF